MRDLIFVLGAGASAGAGGILPERPPLGGQLYGELKKLFPGSWGALPADLRRRLEIGFEDGMAGVAEQFGMAVPQLMRDMAIYFIQFRPVSRDSLYNQVVAYLSSHHLLERTAFSTLNYDCILEFALLQEGSGIDYFGDGAANQTPVWKLHGSCNMFSANIQAGQGIHYGQGVRFEGGIQAWLDSSRVIEHCLVQTGLAPVMCQYMMGKPTTVSPSAIADLQSRWARAVQSAAHIVCIGIRPYPPDAHIWTPLHSATAHIVYAGNETAYQTWAASRASSVETLGDTFVSSLPQLFRYLEGL